MRTTVIMGAAGRDFHVFNTVYRDDPDALVVAFTATQIPGIDGRVYPAALAGRRYPDGIPIVAESELEQVVGANDVDEVVHAYSDVSHVDVMHAASRALAAGADFRIIGPRASMLQSRRPLVAVCAARTGAGKSQTTRRVAAIVRERGLVPVVVRHPMPYGDLEAMAVQRFASIDDIDAADTTIEEREEYEHLVDAGIVTYAGVDYAAILAEAEAEADVVIWDGGNNDLPFYQPDVHVTLVDPLRPGHEERYHPGEANVRRADVVVVNKVDAAGSEAVEEAIARARALNPHAAIVQTASPVTLDAGPELAGQRVLVVEDGPTLTHGEMPTGAGAAAARAAGAELVDPREIAVGSIAEAFVSYPHLGPVLPAVGYSPSQLADLEATIAAADCDAVIVGTPIDLSRVVRIDGPVRRATYELRAAGEPRLEDVLDGVLTRAAGAPGRES